MATRTRTCINANTALQVQLQPYHTTSPTIVPQEFRVRGGGDKLTGVPIINELQLLLTTMHRK